MSFSSSSSSPTDVVAALSASWFGAGLPPETVARLAGIATMRDVAAGS